MLPPANQVSVMTTYQVEPELQGVPPVAAHTATRPHVTDLGNIARRASLKTIAQLADPMQSEVVKGWLLSNLFAPK